MTCGGARVRGLALLCVLCFAGVPAAAQDVTSEPPADAGARQDANQAPADEAKEHTSDGAPSDAFQPTVTSPATPQVTSTPVACRPRCRSGFTCIDGACVSACNPPCAVGDTCDASGECVNHEREREAHSVRRHDGFYLRLELGAGYLYGSRVSERSDNELGGEVTGVAQVGGLMLGGTIARGLVLGGGVWGTNAPKAEYSGQVYQSQAAEGSTIVERTADVDLASTSVIGPFLAWYPDPTKGLNAEVALGVALATIGSYLEADTFYIDGYAGAGWGLQVGVGYDFWIGEQWSLGLMARASYVNVGVSDGTDTLTAWVPALAGAATFH